MDIKSLKIGDIVTTKDNITSNSDGNYYEITKIDSRVSYMSKGGTKHIGCVSLEPIKKELPYVGGAWVDYLEPIPITDELLEKVGFNFAGFDGYRMCEKYYNLGIKKYNEYYHFSYNGTVISDYPISKAIRYLHELQHEMFDAGIEFEIKI